ncbi:MAG: hypothetical protein JXR10_05700 [Cyclobacteriaceae bacterium]
MKTLRIINTFLVVIGMLLIAGCMKEGELIPETLDRINLFVHGDLTVYPNNEPIDFSVEVIEGDFDRIEILINDSMVHTTYDSPYKFRWYKEETITPGVYRIKAIVYNIDAATELEEVQIEIEDFRNKYVGDYHFAQLNNRYSNQPSYSSGWIKKFEPEDTILYEDLLAGFTSASKSEWWSQINKRITIYRGNELVITPALEKDSSSTNEGIIDGFSFHKSPDYATSGIFLSSNEILLNVRTHGYFNPNKFIDYTVSGKKVTSVVDVHLSTQQEVDDFRFSGHGSIEGTLTIGCDECDNHESESITNLDGLGYLNAVGSVRIEGNVNLTDLSGLLGITSLENLWIHDNPSLTHLYGLKSLTSVDNIGIVNNDSLTNLNGLLNVKSIGSGTISDNASLTNFCGIRNTIIQSLQIENNRSNPTSSDIKRGICDNNDPIIYNGDWSIGSQARIDDFKYYGYKGITGSFIIGTSCQRCPASYSISNLDGLSRLESVGSLHVSYNAGLTDISGLKSLSSVKEVYFIGNNLPELVGLGNLTSVDKFVLINNRLTNISGLKNLTSVGELYIRWEALSDLNGLNSIDSINRLVIVYNHSLKNLDELINVSSVGSLTILGNESLTDFCGLKNGILDTQGFNISDNGYNPTRSDLLNGDCSE